MGKRPRCGGLPPSLLTTHAPIRQTKMAAHLLALTADGGVPLFTRKLGDVKALPFATVGTLNGVHLYSRLRGSQLLSIRAGESKVLWRIYHDSVVLILVASDDGTDDSHYSQLLDNVFGAMVLFVGLDSLQNIRNVDKLKKELRASHGLVDQLLQQLDQENSTVGDLMLAADYLICPQHQALQSCLQGFVNASGSSYGCLIVHGKIVVATKKWWMLTSQELMLVSALVNSTVKTMSCELKIFLPDSCPKMYNRLLTFTLTQGVKVCVLCGAKPSLEEMELEVPRFWKGSYDILKVTSSLKTKNLPKVVLDKNILGLLLLHTEQSRCICNVLPVEDEITRIKDGKCISLRRRQEILRTLYTFCIGNYFPNKQKDEKLRLQHQAEEMYFITDHYKLYFINKESCQLFLLFTTKIPSYAMRSVTQKTLKMLTSNKLSQF